MENQDTRKARWNRSLVFPQIGRSTGASGLAMDPLQHRTLYISRMEISEEKPRNSENPTGGSNLTSRRRSLVGVSCLFCRTMRTLPLHRSMVRQCVSETMPIVLMIKLINERASFFVLRLLVDCVVDNRFAINWCMIQFRLTNVIVLRVSI